MEDVVLNALNPEERMDVPDRHGLARAATNLYRGLRGQPELSALLNSGNCLYEVPFSYILPGKPSFCLRGVIDCLVIDATGAATVVSSRPASHVPSTRPRPTFTPGRSA
jgi:hypothetical protein